MWRRLLTCLTLLSMVATLAATAARADGPSASNQQYTDPLAGTPQPSQKSGSQPTSTGSSAPSAGTPASTPSSPPPGAAAAAATVQPSLAVTPTAVHRLRNRRHIVLHTQREVAKPAIAPLPAASHVTAPARSSNSLPLIAWVLIIAAVCLVAGVSLRRLVFTARRSAGKSAVSRGAGSA